MINYGKAALVVGCAVAGGALAVTSGAGVLVVGACALAGAGAPSVLRTVGKVAARATGKKVPFDADDVVTIGAAAFGVGVVATLFPDDQKKDPSTVGLAAFAVPGGVQMLTGIVATCGASRQAAANVEERVRGQRNR